MAKKTADLPAFHVVRHSYNDKYTTHSIYGDNAPYLRPAEGEKLGKREAQWIADALNEKLSRVARRKAA